MRDLTDTIVMMLDDMAALGDSTSAHTMAKLMKKLAEATELRSIAIACRCQGAIVSATDHEERAEAIFTDVAFTRLVKAVD